MRENVLRLQPALSEIAVMNRWLEQAFVRAGIDRRIASDVKLCLNEAVTNVISYGAPLRPNSQITIALHMEPERAVAVVSDTCAAFNPVEYPMPDKIHGLADARVGGFGIHIIRSTASVVRYERIDDTNRLTLECHLPRP